MSWFPGIGVFEIVALYMKVTMVNDYNYAYNKTSLTSKATWGQEAKVQNPCLCSKIKSMTEWPLSNLKCQNAIAIWYFNENELICDFRGHIGLKQPRNNKFKIDWAQAFSSYPHLKQPVHFISDRSFKMHTKSES